MPYIMAIDVGTTNIKAALLNHEGLICAISERKVEVYFPEPGFVEQDPEQIYHAAVGVINEILHKAAIGPNDVMALGIANQRINVVMWDVRTGKPIYNAMGWQDQRGPELTPGFMMRQTVEYTLASLVAGKILWLYEKKPDLRSQTESGEVIFGGIDTWLLWKLTGGQVHATDVSNASTTILYDMTQMCWNRQLLTEVNIPLNIFPAVKDSSHIYGRVSTPDLDITCPIAALAADQQASLFGHRCFYPGQAKITFGTGSFVLVNMGSSRNLPPQGIIKHVAWSLEGKKTYAMEGSILCSGSALEWLADDLGLIRSLDDLEQLAKSVESSEGVFFVPALAGLGSPSWDTRASGLLIGLTRSTRKSHIARAALESLAFQVREIIDVMRPVFPGTENLRIDGRPAMNDFLAQTLADICGVPVERDANHNLTLKGAAYLAGLAIDFWTSLDEISEFATNYKIFEPHRNIEKEYSKWCEAVRRSRDWF